MAGWCCHPGKSTVSINTYSTIKQGRPEVKMTLDLSGMYASSEF